VHLGLFGGLPVCVWCVWLGCWGGCLRSGQCLRFCTWWPCKSSRTAPSAWWTKSDQGMDATNERKMFQQLVRATCKDNTPQCFLITPKLLPGLDYGPRCTIHTVMNGPYNRPITRVVPGQGLSLPALTYLLGPASPCLHLPTCFWHLQTVPMLLWAVSKGDSLRQAAGTFTGVSGERPTGGAWGLACQGCTVQSVSPCFCVCFLFWLCRFPRWGGAVGDPCCLLASHWVHEGLPAGA